MAAMRPVPAERVPRRLASRILANSARVSEPCSASMAAIRGKVAIDLAGFEIYYAEWVQDRHKELGGETKREEDGTMVWDSILDREPRRRSRGAGLHPPSVIPLSSRPTTARTFDEVRSARSYEWTEL